MQDASSQMRSGLRCFCCVGSISWTLYISIRGDSP